MNNWAPLPYGQNATLGVVEAPWSINILGPLKIEHRGEPFKTRTIFHSLLIARLCAYHPTPIPRRDLAESFWPDAERSNALAYLRRTVMELRKADFPIVTTGERISLEPTAINCDLIQAKSGNHWRLAKVKTESILQGIDHPVAREIREDIGRTLYQLATKGSAYSQKNDPGERVEVLERLGAFAIEHQPDLAIRFFVDHPDLFLDVAAQDTLLDAAKKLLTNKIVSAEVDVRFRVLAARMARIKTRYLLAEKWIQPCLEACLEGCYPSIAADVYNEWAFAKMELRDWDSSMHFSELAIQAAETIDDANALSIAYDSLARTQWQIGEYAESAQNYLKAYEHCRSQPRRGVLLANLAFLWGVLQVPCNLPEAEEPEEGFGFYEAGANSYRLFATHFGKGEYEEAAKHAAIQIEITANMDMERLFAVTIDCAALAFSSLNRPNEAAACIRIGSRLRRQLSHPRAKMESDSLRMHVKTKLFGFQIASLIAGMQSNDLKKLSQAISRRLRKLS